MYPYTLAKKSNLTDHARDLLAQELFWSRAQEEQWRQSLKATLYSLRKLALQHMYVEEPKQKPGQTRYHDLEHLIIQITHRLSMQTAQG